MILGSEQVEATCGGFIFLYLYSDGHLNSANAERN